MVLVAIRSH